MESLADRVSDSRRVFLGQLAAATAGVLAPGRTARPAPPALRRLTPVSVFLEARIRQVVGHRPYRPSGFVVRGEKLDDRLVVHNYGHGGGGISLSWGSSSLAAEIARESSHRRAAVIGCGALGLTSARLLQDAGFEVTVYARDLPPNTTSNVAGGLWDPFSVSAPGHTTPAYDRQFERAVRFAYRRYQDLVGERYGVRWMETLFLGPEPMVAEGIVFDLLRPTRYGPGQHPFPARHVTSVVSLLIEPARYLPALMSDVREAGARIAVREFVDRASLLSLTEPLIVNCTGLGAASLFGDDGLVPVKGQLEVLRPQADVDHILIQEEPGLLYMMPRTDGVVLGGTYVPGDASTSPDPAESQRILDGHSRLNAALRAAHA